MVHFECNQQGTEVLTSAWDKPGGIVVCSDEALKEIKRIQEDGLVSPSGTWNVRDTVHDVY